MRCPVLTCMLVIEQSAGGDNCTPFLKSTTVLISTCPCMPRYVTSQSMPSVMHAFAGLTSALCIHTSSARSFACLTGSASSIRPDGQAAAAQATQQDLLGDLLDLNEPEPAPAAAAPPPATSNNSVQDLLGWSPSFASYLLQVHRASTWHCKH